MTSPLHDQPLLPHLIVRSLEAHDDAPCIHLAGRVATYAEIRRRTSQLIQAQRARGVTRGTRLAVLSKNRPEVLTNLTASLVNGCVLTPLHPMGSLADHAYVIGDAEIECLVFDADNFTERARELKARYPDLTLLGFGPNDVGDDYLALADEFEPAPLDAPDVGPEDLCTIVYTGGTTGRPKGVLMSHRVWAAMTWIQMAEWEFPDPLRIAVATPLSHAAMSLVAPVLLSGGAFYVMESFSPDGFFDLVAEHRITATLIVPVMLYALQGHARYATADMSSMETIFYGASPMSPAKLAKAIEDWGPIFFQFYGQTEAPMVIAHLKKGEHDPARPDRLASCGRPVPWMHVALLDSDDQTRGARSVRRDLHPWSARDDRLQGPARRDRRSAVGRLVAHRRRRPLRRRRLPVHRRPDQGHGDHRRLQRVPPRGRGRDQHPSRREHGHGRRRAGRQVGRGGEGRRRAPARPRALGRADPGAATTREGREGFAAVTEVDRLRRRPSRSPPVGKPDKKAVRAPYWNDVDRAVS